MSLTLPHRFGRITAMSGRIPSLLAALLSLTVAAPAQTPGLPATPLTFGFFTVRFETGGAFSLQGDGWPTFTGTWTLSGGELRLETPAVRDCGAAGRYTVRQTAGRVQLALVSDDCVPRRMILDRSDWRPAGTAVVIPERTITRVAAPKAGALPAAAPAAGSWPSFRGRDAAGDGGRPQLPDTWNGATGQNVLWKVALPGLGHSSPVVWGDRVFVTTAISSRGSDSFKPGLYGDGDASDDRSSHRWTIAAYDARTGARLWERVAFEGVPVDARHIKSTYASATPVTDGRLVIASFGSQGVYAYDVNGTFRWKVDLGHIHLGAYDIPSFEWGLASSPILWNGLAILQVDTHTDSFVIALDAETGETVWKTARDEFPSWGTPTVVSAPAGPELVTNASKLIRGYDPRSGRELWRLGGSSKITAPTPIFSDNVIVVASGRAPERPIFAIRPGARGDLTLAAGQTSSNAIAWSRTGRGPYMPTPLIHDGLLYVLANNGVFDVYDLKTGEEVYRQRLSPIGSGFSASPVVADGRIILSSEDGEMLVVAAGRRFTQLSINSMGDQLMATPAFSARAMFVRSAHHLFAIGTR
jgi:outer membrane protein assembly factor BamB